MIILAQLFAVLDTSRLRDLFTAVFSLHLGHRSYMRGYKYIVLLPDGHYLSITVLYILCILLRKPSKLHLQIKTTRTAVIELQRPDFPI